MHAMTFLLTPVIEEAWELMGAKLQAHVHTMPFTDKPVGPANPWIKPQAPWCLTEKAE